MPWLLRDGDVLASLEVADTFRARRRGLLGRDGCHGALLLEPARAVHTLGMRFPIDVAFCAVDGDELVVLDTVRMRAWRLGRPRSGCRRVIEAEAGAFERWHLDVGDRLQLKGRDQ